MTQFKFRCERPDGFNEVKVKYRGKSVIETLGPMAQNDETRIFDDTDETDAKCVKSLESHKYYDPSTGTYVQSFTKLTV